jgi:hypothetical protein
MEKALPGIGRDRAYDSSAGGGGADGDRSENGKPGRLGGVPGGVPGRDGERREKAEETQEALLRERDRVGSGMGMAAAELDDSGSAQRGIAGHDGPEQERGMEVGMGTAVGSVAVERDQGRMAEVGRATGVSGL